MVFNHNHFHPVSEFTDNNIWNIYLCYEIPNVIKEYLHQIIVIRIGSFENFRFLK